MDGWLITCMLVFWTIKGNYQLTRDYQIFRSTHHFQNCHQWLQYPFLLGSRQHQKMASWLKHGKIEIPDNLLFKKDFESHTGSWIAARGYLVAADERGNRRAFGILNALLVSKNETSRLVKALGNYNDKHVAKWRLPDTSENYYLFGGEIPWSPYFRDNNSGSKDGNAYVSASGKLMVALLFQSRYAASSYTWEKHHSQLNQTEPTLIPSDLFSTTFGLHGLAQSFNQALPDNTLAGSSFRAPSGFDGNLLYLREDLVHKYANGRDLIWFVWGERQFRTRKLWNERPDWLVGIASQGEDIWRYASDAKRLSPMFKSRPTRKRKMLRNPKRRKFPASKCSFWSGKKCSRYPSFAINVNGHHFTINLKLRMIVSVQFSDPQ